MNARHLSRVASLALIGAVSAAEVAAAQSTGETTKATEFVILSDYSIKSVDELDVNDVVLARVPSPLTVAPAR
jgi:hypothetical protein